MKRVVRVDFVIDPDMLEIDDNDETAETLVRSFVSKYYGKGVEATIISVETLAEDEITDSRPWSHAEVLDQKEVNIEEKFHTLACQQQWQSGKCICMTWRHGSRAI